MRIQFARVGAILMLMVCHASATVLYVNVNGTSPTPPYDTWGTAATDIQTAVNAANPGDIVLVTNGVYASGSQNDEYGVPSRLAITTPVTVQSVNGPGATLIMGDQFRWIFYRIFRPAAICAACI
jgi:hypothetical protein